MAINQVKRVYRMDDVELITVMKNYCRYFRQDLAELSKYGMDESTIDFLDSFCLRMQSMGDDVYYKYNIVEQTESLKARKSDLITTIRMIVVRAKACFGDKSTFVKNLRMAELTRYSYDKLISAAKETIPLLEEYLEPLKKFGMTEESIAELSDKIKALEEAKLAQKTEQDRRIDATAERIKLNNELFETVTMYAKIAKAAFAKSDPERYSHYLLSRYAKPRKKKSEGQPEE